MVALGQENAGEVLKYLTDYEIEDITHTITELKGQGPISVETEHRLG